MENIPIKIRWLLGLLILLGLVMAGSYLYTKSINNSLPEFTPLSKEDSKNLGVKAVQKMFDEYPQFTKKAFIQQQLEGTLKIIDENSWTIEAEGKALTLVNQGTNKVRLTKLPKTATGSTKILVPVEIKATDLKIGDLVSITQVIDWQTGKVTITGITVLPH